MLRRCYGAECDQVRSLAGLCALSERDSACPGTGLNIGAFDTTWLAYAPSWGLCYGSRYALSTLLSGTTLSNARSISSSAPWSPWP